MPEKIAAVPFEDLKIVAGWVALTLVLTQSSDQTSLSVVLFSLVLAELFGHLLTAGLCAPTFNLKSAGHWEDTMGRIMLRWILLMGLVIALIYSKLLVFFEYYPFAVVCVLGLSLILALLKNAAWFQKETRKWIEALFQLRLIIIVLSILFLTLLAPITIDLALVLSVAVLLCILALSLWGASSFGIEIYKEDPAPICFGRSLVAAAPLLFRYADLLILPLILTPTNTYVYLMARGYAHATGLILGRLNAGLFDPLVAAFEQGKRSDFVAVVARANLGILLIGGSASLAVLSAAPYILAVLGANTAEAHKVLLFAVVAESAPIFFGATTILMSVVHKQREATLIAGAGTILIWAVTIFVGISDITKLAMIFTCTYLACTAATAVFLGVKFGIWPGLTAILFRQIKLL